MFGKKLTTFINMLGKSWMSLTSHIVLARQFYLEDRKSQHISLHKSPGTIPLRFFKKDEIEYAEDFTKIYLYK